MFNPHWYQPLFSFVLFISPFILFLVNIFLSVMLHPLVVLTAFTFEPVCVEFYQYNPFSEDALQLPRTYFKVELTSRSWLLENWVTDTASNWFQKIFFGWWDWFFGHSRPISTRPVQVDPTCPVDQSPDISLSSPHAASPGNSMETPNAKSAWGNDPHWFYFGC